MNVASWLERIAARDPGRPALHVGARCVLRYGEFRDAAARVAGWLAARGLAHGDRVAIYMANRFEYLVLMQGALWAGMVVVPVNVKLHAREAKYVCEHSGAALLVVDTAVHAVDASPASTPMLLIDELMSQAQRVHPLPLRDAAAEDLAWLFYTSGTTGRPKGVMLTHRNLMAMTLCYQADVEQVEPQDNKVYAAPMSHGAGLYAFAYIAAGARHVVPETGGFDEAELVALASRMGRLCLFAAPTMVRRLVDEVERTGADASGFKTIVYGGGPMYVADILRARSIMGPRFVQIYGQGESPMTITVLTRLDIEDEAHPRWMARLGSVGCRQSAVEVRVVDCDGRALPAGNVGEVVVRGDTVMHGYWHDAAATTRTLRDGWLWTGDMGVLDDSGFLTLKDRSKDLIISGGSNIYPREVEEVLLQHPAVVEVAAIGIPDAEWGEVVVAYVVLREGVTGIDAELDALCLSRIARFKRPKRYFEVDALPKNNYGKVLKTTLRDRHGRA